MLFLFQIVSCVVASQSSVVKNTAVTRFFFFLFLCYAMLKIPSYSTVVLLCILHPNCNSPDISLIIPSDSFLNKQGTVWALK